MNYDPKFLQFMLANLQASNQMVIKTYTYPNPLKGKENIPLNNEKEIAKKASEVFKTRLPEYNLENLLVDKLTGNVLTVLRKNRNLETINIDNGCCSMPLCPTQQFYESVLEVIKIL